MVLNVNVAVKGKLDLVGFGLAMLKTMIGVNYFL